MLIPWGHNREKYVAGTMNRLTKKKHIPFIFKDAEARKYRPPLTRGPEVSLCDLNSTNHWILLTWNQKKTSMKRN